MSTRASDILNHEGNIRLYYLMKKLSTNIDVFK